VSKLLNIALGFVVGMVVVGVAGWNMMPGMMLEERLSPYSMEKTVSTIKENALAEGWVVPSIKPLHKSVKKHGGGDVLPVMLVNLCQAHHAAKMLGDDTARVVSVFMPCTISVYKKADGKVYISSMNAALLGKMFGGIVSVVMGEVSVDQQKFIAFAK
jgi:uncharacterized protein (DUF302 family)